MTEAEEIERFIAEHGVTACPTVYAVATQAGVDNEAGRDTSKRPDNKRTKGGPHAWRLTIWKKRQNSRSYRAGDRGPRLPA